MQYVGKSGVYIINCWPFLTCLTFNIFAYVLLFHFSQVVVTQMNGADHPSESIHVFHVGKMRIKLRKGKMTIAKEYYSSSMQVQQLLLFHLSISCLHKDDFDV